MRCDTPKKGRTDGALRPGLEVDMKANRLCRKLLSVSIGAGLFGLFLLAWDPQGFAGGARSRTAARTRGAAPSSSPCSVNKPGMVCVPAGSFTMGSYSGDNDEEPPHKVWVDEFLIDKFEVTFEQYNRCVKAGNCRKPHIILLSRFKNNGGKPKKGTKVKVAVDQKFPVVGITWEDADKYCRAIGKRLPTEAEWEKAARGTDARRYPWGSQAPSCRLANIDLCGRKLSEVGKHPKGASPYGAQDMTGNVWEWVADWYDPKFYSKPEAGRNPVGPLNPVDPVTGRLVYRYKVLRGGSYTGSPGPMWTSYRFRLLPNTRGDDIGFRCAYSVKPPPRPAAAPASGGTPTGALPQGLRPDGTRPDEPVPDGASSGVESGGAGADAARPPASRPSPRP